jgi:uncharacterized protein (DUF427 family)
MSDLASWTIDVPVPRVEPTPRWVRVRAGQEVVADSRDALLLSWYGPGMLPTYCFRDEDVRTDLLVAASGSVLPHASTYDVVSADLRIPGAAFRFDTSPDGSDALLGHWTFAWDAGVAWFEEALEVHVHARDPHKRVDAVPSERHLRIQVDGAVIADSLRPVAVFETTLPTRWYLPLDDVRSDVLVPSATTSRCPYKGTASYFSVRVGDVDHPDVAWSYAEPVVECPRIAGLVSFFNERVDVFVDGRLESRPRTPWST